MAPHPAVPIFVGLGFRGYLKGVPRTRTEVFWVYIGEPLCVESTK